MNDDLPARIISGRVQVKPNVKEFCGSSVVFDDGSVIDEVCGFFIRVMAALPSRGKLIVLLHACRAGGRGGVCHRLRVQLPLPALSPAG